LAAPCQTLRGQQEVGHVVLKVEQRRQGQIERRSELDDIIALGDAVLVKHGIHDLARGQGVDLESWVQGFE
jgi:hypothetical protein